jgi:hypothetical protein
MGDIRDAEEFSVWVWMAAGAAYALTMATAWGKEEGWGSSSGHSISIQHRVVKAKREAAATQSWFDALLDSWLACGDVTCSRTAEALLDKLRWFTSPEGSGMVSVMRDEASVIH